MKPRNFNIKKKEIFGVSFAQPFFKNNNSKFQNQRRVFCQAHLFERISDGRRRWRRRRQSLLTCAAAGTSFCSASLSLSVFIASSSFNCPSLPPLLFLFQFPSSFFFFFFFGDREFHVNVFYFFFFQEFNLMFSE